MIFGKNLVYNYLPLIVIGIVLTGLLIYLKVSTPTTTLKKDSLEPYSTSLRYEPIDVIDLENQTGDPCSPSEPKLCDTENQFSCISCKSGMAICTHLKNDLSYIDDDTGESKILKANNVPTQGYCLPIQNLAQNCNPYHGKWALTKLNPEDEVIFITCECIRPGIIGKDTLLGDCTTSYICEFKNINVPFESLECICQGGSKPAFEEQPICKFPTLGSGGFTIDEFEKALPAAYSRAEMVSTDYFADKINNAVTVSKLPSPCSYCPITGEFISSSVEKIVVDNEDTYICRPLDPIETVIPIRIDPNSRILKGARGPDAIIKANWEHRTFINGLKEGLVIYELPKSKNEKLFQLLGITDEVSFLHFKGPDFQFWVYLDPIRLEYSIPYLWTDADIFNMWGWYYNMDSAAHYDYSQRKISWIAHAKYGDIYKIAHQRFPLSHKLKESARNYEESVTYLYIDPWGRLYFHERTLDAGIVGFREGPNLSVNGQRRLAFVTVDSDKLKEYKDLVIYPGSFGPDTRQSDIKITEVE